MKMYSAYVMVDAELFRDGLRNMECDKCGQQVDPDNNVVFFDVAWSSLDSEYRPTMGGLGIVEYAFTHEEIVPENPNASILNVNREWRFRARHLFASDTCEGSPSRQRCINEGICGDDTQLSPERRAAVQEACEILKTLKRGDPVEKS